jgi:hypothetical protein
VAEVVRSSSIAQTTDVLFPEEVVVLEVAERWAGDEEGRLAVVER